MEIILERGSWFRVKTSFNWDGEVSYNPSFHQFTFFASSKPKHPYDSSYAKAKELSTLLTDFLDFDFYKEEEIDKVMFHPKKDCWITFK